MRHYDIHITIADRDRWDDFVPVCESLGVKPLHLANYCRNGELLHEVMTGGTVRAATDQDALQRMFDISHHLMNAGLTVSCQKIEVDPSHPSVRDTVPKWTYVEPHIKCSLVVTPPTAIETLARYGAYLSRTLSSTSHFVTLRSYDGLDDLTARIRAIVPKLGSVAIVQPVSQNRISDIEFVLHDTSYCDGHMPDAVWMDANTV